MVDYLQKEYAAFVCIDRYSVRGDPVWSCAIGRYSRYGFKPLFFIFNGGTTRWIGWEVEGDSIEEAVLCLYNKIQDKEKILYFGVE